MVDYSARVKKTMNYINARLGSTITYNRFKSMGEWSPTTGYTKTWWESPSFTATIHGAEEDEIDRSGGRLQMGDIAISFLASEFTNQGTSGGLTDTGAPRAGDEITYSSDTWTTALGESGEMICKLDITSSTYTVYARRQGE